MKPFAHLLTLALTLLLLGGCKKHEHSPAAVPAQNHVQQGRWRISLFREGSRIETVHFTGYEFQFNANGSVAASRSGGTPVTGAWSTGTHSGGAHFTLVFGSTAPFNELNEDWHITEQTPSTLKLHHASGGSGDDDYLEFQKI